MSFCDCRTKHDKVVKLVKTVLRDLIRDHIAVKLAQCNQMVKEYGASAFSWMSIPCVSHHTYKECIARSDGVDVSRLSSLKTILVHGILERLETGELPLESICIMRQFQHNLTKLLENYVCRRLFDHNEGLHVELSKTFLLRRPKITCYFKKDPDPDIVNRCIEVALRLDLTNE